MSQPPSEDGDPGLEAGLAIRRNARRGFGLGAAVAAVVFVFFALLPDTPEPTALYVGLAVVLGVSLGLLVTVVLVGWRVRRLTREL